MAEAITYSQLGGPDVLALTEITAPAPQSGEVRVRIEAAGVNPIDAKLRSGRREAGPFTGPRGVGFDGAGVITDVGAGVDGFTEGDRVVLFNAPGAYASEITVPVNCVQPRPDVVSAAQGAALGIPVGTAYQSLRSLGVGPRDTVLIHGGSGAVGQAAIQYALLWGARVIATSSPRRFERVLALGATPVAYGMGLVETVRDLAPEGVSVALDAAGTDEAIEASKQLVSDPQRIATIVRGADADASGIRAFRAGHPNPLTPQQEQWRAEAIPVTLALMAAEQFSVQLGPSFPLANAAEAHRQLEKGAEGKITLHPGTLD